jgi:hypothetical protein
MRPTTTQEVTRTSSVWALGLLLAGCYGTNARRSPFDDVDASLPPAVCPGVAADFRRTEIYVESPSPACAEPRSACMVYRLEGNPRSDCTERCASPEEARRRAFCTCRCDGPTPCACAAGEVCESTGFSFGSFCVASDIVDR